MMTITTTTMSNDDDDDDCKTGLIRSNISQTGATKYSLLVLNSENRCEHKRTIIATTMIDDDNHDDLLDVEYCTTVSSGTTGSCIGATATAWRVWLMVESLCGLILR
jgi:hypothetical protein